jgi:hypothetical protein
MKRIPEGTANRKKKEAPGVTALALGHKFDKPGLPGDDQAGKSTITFMLDAPFVSI